MPRSGQRVAVPSPGGPSSPPRARAYPSAALSPSRGRCTRFRSGLATPGVREDLFWRDLYVRDGVVATVPCTSSMAAVCHRELLSAVVSCVSGRHEERSDSSRYIRSSAQYAARRLVVVKDEPPKGLTGGFPCVTISRRCCSHGSDGDRFRVAVSRSVLALRRVGWPN